MKPSLREVIGAARALVKLDRWAEAYDSRIEPGCFHRKLSRDGAVALGFRYFIGPSFIRMRGSRWVHGRWIFHPEPV